MLIKICIFEFFYNDVAEILIESQLWIIQELNAQNLHLKTRCHLQSLWPSVGQRTEIMSLHWVFSFTIAWASIHVKPISLSSITAVLLQVVLGLTLILLPAGVHLTVTLGIHQEKNAYYNSVIKKVAPSESFFKD